jgi:hypothetical protein
MKKIGGKEKSLHDICYKNNSHFLKFIQAEGWEFKPFSDFTKVSIEERQQLYNKLCTKIWNVELG